MSNRSARTLRLGIPPVWIFAALIVAWLAVMAFAQSPQAPPAPPVLITGARILDPAAGRYLPPAVVLIDKGRIVSIGKDEPQGLPENVQRLSLPDSTLVPGLVDANAPAAPTADLDADHFAGMALANGVTACRALNLRTSWATAQRRRVEAGAVLGPRLFVSGRGIDQGARPDLWLLDAPDAATATSEVARQIAARVDWIAGYDHLTPEVYAAMTAAAKGSATRVTGVPGAASMADLATSGVQSIDTLNWPLTPRKNGDAAAADRAWTDVAAKDLAALATRLVRARVTLVPQLASLFPAAFPSEVEKDPALAMLPAARRDALLAQLKNTLKADASRAARAWSARAAFLVRFVKAGGRVATGTGFSSMGYPVPGVGLHRELAALVRAGLTPADALRAATTNGAALLGAEASLGAIVAGRDADLFVVKGDPLANIGDLASITHVIRRGEVFEPKGLLRQ